MNFKKFFYKKVNSTNDLAIKKIKTGFAKGIIIADFQKKGRGQYGNKWLSYKGNLFMTIFFEIKKNIKLKKITTLNCKIIKSALIQYFKKSIAIKYPNDLLVNNKKICGILQETAFNKDGKFNVNIEDDVIRGTLVTHQSKVMFPPPPPKPKAIATNRAVKSTEKSSERKKQDEIDALKKAGTWQITLLIFGGLFMAFLGQYAPAEFMQHFIVFALSCFVGFQIIWNVNHALHTPLMAVTNAISGIIVVGALLQVGSSNFIVEMLSSFSVLIATINIVGGFLVTKRMLAMFQRS